MLKLINVAAEVPRTFTGIPRLSAEVPRTFAGTPRLSAELPRPSAGIPRSLTGLSFISVSYSGLLAELTCSNRCRTGFATHVALGKTSMTQYDIQ